MDLLRRQQYVPTHKRGYLSLIVTCPEYTYNDYVSDYLNSCWIEDHRLWNQYARRYATVVSFICVLLFFSGFFFWYPNFWINNNLLCYLQLSVYRCIIHVQRYPRGYPTKHLLGGAFAGIIPDRIATRNVTQSNFVCLVWEQGISFDHLLISSYDLLHFTYSLYHIADS